MLLDGRRRLYPGRAERINPPVGPRRRLKIKRQRTQSGRGGRRGRKEEEEGEDKRSGGGGRERRRKSEEEELGVEQVIKEEITWRVK